MFTLVAILSMLPLFPQYQRDPNFPPQDNFPQDKKSRGKIVKLSDCLGETTRSNDSEEESQENYSSIGISFSGNKMVLTINEWEYYCSLKNFIPLYDIDGDIITIQLTPSEIPTYCICRFNATFSFANIESGSYLVRVLNGESYMESPRLFYIDLQNGIDTQLTEEETLAGKMLTNNKEWVYYNENENGDRNIFRIRYKKFENNWADGLIQMSYSPTFEDPIDLATAEEVQNGTIKLRHSSAELPMNLIRYAPKEELVKIREEEGDDDIHYPIPSSPFQETGTSSFYFDFFNDFYEEMKLTNLETVATGDGVRLKSIYSNGFEWLQGIGPVSSIMPQTFVLPVYATYEDTSDKAMTKLMYVWDINERKLIYGNPDMDPAWVTNSVEENHTDDSILIYDNTIEFLCDKNGMIEILSLSGTCLQKAETNCGQAFLNTAELPRGIYVVRSYSASGEKYKKIILK